MINSSFDSRFSLENLFDDHKAYESFVFGNTAFLFLNMMMYLTLVFNSVSEYKTYRNFIFSNVNISKFLVLETFYILKNKYYISHLLTYLLIVFFSVEFFTITRLMVFAISCLAFQIISLIAFIVIRILVGHNTKGIRNFPTVFYFVLSLFFMTIITQNGKFLYPLYPLVDLPFSFVLGFRLVSLLSAFILILLLVGAYVYKREQGTGLV